MVSAVPIENGLRASILISSASALAVVATTAGLHLVAKYQVKSWDAGDYCALEAFVVAPVRDEISAEVTNMDRSWPTRHCTSC